MWHTDMGIAPQATLPNPDPADLRTQILGLSEATPFFRLWWQDGVLTFGMAAERRVWICFTPPEKAGSGQYLVDPAYTLRDGYIDSWGSDGLDLIPRYLTVSRVQAINLAVYVLNRQALPPAAEWC